MRRWTRRFTLVAVATLALAAAGQPSANAACSVVDITCQVDGAVDVIEDVVNDVPIDTPLDGEIDPIVDDVLDRVDDVVGGGPVDLPDVPEPDRWRRRESRRRYTGRSDSPPRETPSPTGQGRGVSFGARPDGPGLTRLPQAVDLGDVGGRPLRKRRQNSREPLRWDPR